MNWAAELEQALCELQEGKRPRVGFADRQDTVGEVGREFNALAAGLDPADPGELGREKIHHLRNRLAGLLAGLYLLRETGRLTPEEEVALRRVEQEARQLDARLRAH